MGVRARGRISPPRPQKTPRGDFRRLPVLESLPDSLRQPHGPCVNSNPFDNVALSGAGNPLSRPQNCESITVPGAVRYGAGVPPRAPTENEFMSIEYCPEQSFGGGLPPDPSGIERRIGPFMQRGPPENATAARPVLE